MDLPGHIEQATIATLDERRNDLRSCRDRETAHRWLPGRLCKRAVLSPRMGDFSRREHDQRAPFTQPEVRGAKTGTTPGDSIRPIEWIDEQTEFAQFRNARQ
jgi:hypothetical protein